MIIVVADFSARPCFASVGGGNAETVGTHRDGAVRVEGEDIEERVGEVFALPLLLPRPAGIGRGQNEGIVADGPAASAIGRERDTGQCRGSQRRGGVPRSGVIGGAENGAAFAHGDDVGPDDSAVQQEHTRVGDGGTELADGEGGDE